MNENRTDEYRPGWLARAGDRRVPPRLAMGLAVAAIALVAWWLGSGQAWYWLHCNAHGGWIGQ